MTPGGSLTATRPADPASQAQALLGQYAAAARGRARPGDREAGRALLSAEPAARVAAILALLRVSERDKTDPTILRQIGPPVA